MRRAKEHYVNNKDFLHAIIQYKDKVAAAKEKGEKRMKEKQRQRRKECCGMP